MWFTLTMGRLPSHEIWEKRIQITFDNKSGLVINVKRLLLIENTTALHASPLESESASLLNCLKWLTLLLEIAAYSSFFVFLYWPCNFPNSGPFKLHWRLLYIKPRIPGFFISEFYQEFDIWSLYIIQPCKILSLGPDLPFFTKSADITNENPELLTDDGDINFVCEHTHSKEVLRP